MQRFDFHLRGCQGVRLLFWVGALSLVSPAWGQYAGPTAPASTLDPYGNALPQDLERRTISGFPNEFRRSFLQIYQEEGRRSELRTGKANLGWPEELFSPFRPRRPTNPSDPLAPEDLTSATRKAFQRYGGFEPRAHVPPQEGIRALFARRSGLVQATAFNAPIYRALNRPGVAAAPRAVVGQTPYLPSATGSADESVLTLDRGLRFETDRVHEQVRAEAWEWFRMGHYRQAARAFETAGSLDPTDVESRMGEMLCHFSVGAWRTAAAVVGEVARRDLNPFLTEANLNGRFGNPDEARRVHVEVRLLGEAAATNADAGALRSLLLWSFGERDEALVAASAMPREHPGSPYAGWASRMQAALKRHAEEREPSAP